MDYINKLMDVKTNKNPLQKMDQGEWENHGVATLHVFMYCDTMKTSALLYLEEFKCYCIWVWVKTWLILRESQK